ncbi:class I SAM-dependent methyltransferase [Paenibacillus glacialis]|uniref:Methyltransferase n=1 Tax=Paenibacillus glacialis TaxID=494026 RepID=A0A168NNE8_9BACL|nr:class I SAM-dependent methyltransferase [Paenibacillus glacialis]OAB45965.1 methyltransferase [Paenibacillus glacialis]
MLKSLTIIKAFRQGDRSVLQQNTWLEMITSAEERIVNLERVTSIKEMAEVNPVLDYVERTLEILDKLSLSFWVKEILEEVLIWSEVAKGGTVKDRLAWQAEGINLFVHNVGSSHLYNKYAVVARTDRTDVIHTLIATHGLVGQFLRGEVLFEDNSPLTDLTLDRMLSPEELHHILVPLNRCIITGVSPELWNEVRLDVERIIRNISDHHDLEPEGIVNRLRKLRTAAIRRGEPFEAEIVTLRNHIDIEKEFMRLEDHTLWFVEAALQDFTLEEFMKVFLFLYHNDDIERIRHISFEPLMNTMYYDYKGLKRLNVYKKRIIEKYLQECSWESIRCGKFPDNPHLIHELTLNKELPDTLFFTFTFSSSAEKLIEFCIEAEKSPLYEKAVLLLFDLFDLRRDAYDRFHNEEEYLADMNQTSDYKKVLLDHIVGHKVLDIGPGGGVLLDLMEQEMPHLEPIGIDISSNVIEALERKRLLEGHHWKVMKGDALKLQEYVEPGSIDSVIFSSILHELYSYIPYNGHKFNHDTVAAALASAYDVLAPGGRIIIRDGIMTEPTNQKRRIVFHEPDGIVWLRRYAHDFSGRSIQFEELNDHEAIVPINDAMEFLYTYTWGEDAYVHEIQEQFGYFTPSQYTAFITETLGKEANILVSRHYLQKGYTEALGQRVTLFDEQGNRVPLPDSTCLFVIEKPYE